MLLCNIHSINVTRRIITVPNHTNGRQIASSLQCLSHSSRPFPLTPSYSNLRVFSFTTMNSIPQSTTRPGLAPLRHDTLFRAPLLKRLSQFYTRPGPVGPPHLSLSDLADDPTLTSCSQPIQKVSRNPALHVPHSLTAATTIGALSMTIGKRAGASARQQ